ncbi:germ cell-less protein-like 1 [Ruditapes philippinarum]|uniref:germ cell-less protein-like 1 n=1 Tax=Ruditapes philippinarum TaxID=129788 RepID=UPI00295A900A|nr:germ cell-less protein-like 1 [Ruditapes philippinarum]
MGNLLSRSVTRHDPAIPDERKRKRDDIDDFSTSHLGLLNTPKRKRLQSTSKYIYQTLFLEGEDSDITIHALGRDWKLHKLYLKQSPYFLSMFSGSWIESDMNTINIDILDENITEEALKIAFGSLYKDDVFLKPVQIVSVLAASTLFQLDCLIQQCCIMMKETLSSCTVCVYYTTCQTYGLEDLRVRCLNWLTRNILTTDSITFIRDIGVELMTEIISCSQLYVMQVEIDIYTLLKKWIFLCQNQDWCGETKNLLKDADAFFKKEMKGKSECYLERDEGRKYFQVFAAIRWYHVVNDITSIKMLENDKLLPVGCLNPMFLYGWKRMLSVEQGLDKGPELSIDEAVFNNSCIRCGRVLLKNDDYCWRWVGYNYGVDLLVTITNGIITLKRNTNTETCAQSVSLHDMRYLCYRLTLSSVDKEGNEIFKKGTGIRKIGLGKNEDQIALMIDKNQQFPLALSMNLMFLSPNPDFLPPRLTIPD